MAEIKIYVVNLAKYNEGQDVGKWITLPDDYYDVDDIIEELCPEGEDFAIHDYETPDVPGLKIGENSSIDEINEYAEFLNDNDDSMDIICALGESEGDFDRVMEVFNSGDYLFYPDVSDDEGLGQNAIDEGLVGAETKQNYIDYEAVGRDYAIDAEEGVYDDFGVAEDDDDALGQEVIEQGLMDVNTLPDYYIDTDALGRDIRLEGGVVYTKWGAIQTL